MTKEFNRAKFEELKRLAGIAAISLHGLQTAVFEVKDGKPAMAAQPELQFGVDS